MKRIISAVLAVAGAALLVSGCGLFRTADDYVLEQVKKDIRVGPIIENDKIVPGVVQLIRVDAGDFTYAVKKGGALPKERTKLGGIAFEVGISKAAEDKYNVVLILSYFFPAKEKEAPQSARAKFQFSATAKELSALKAKMDENPQELLKVADAWVGAVEEQGGKVNYQYQYLFKTTLKEALRKTGMQILGTLADAINELLAQYPAISADIEKQGGIDAYIKMRAAAEQGAQVAQGPDLPVLSEANTGYGTITKGMTVAEVEKVLPPASQTYKDLTRLEYREIMVYDSNWQGQVLGLVIELEDGRVKDIRLVR